LSIAPPARVVRVRENAPVVRQAPIVPKERIVPPVLDFRPVQGPVVRGVGPVPDAPSPGSKFRLREARIDRSRRIAATID
jgi:hypothetical protein